MLIVLPYFRGDYELATGLCRWLVELGGDYRAHDFLAVRDNTAGPIPDLPEFKSVQEIIVRDTHHHWPESANLMMRCAGKHIEYSSRQFFLWLEADTAILRPSAFDEIEAEYRGCGKPFLGDRMTDPGTVPHMSGLAVYPGALSHYAGSIYQAFEDPFDAVAGNQIIPNMCQSELIFQAWKCPPFASWEDFETKVLSKRPKCALFHSDKSGRLIEILRERKNLPVPVLDEVGTRQVETPATMACDGPITGSHPESDVTNQVRESTKLPSVDLEAVADSRSGQNLERPAYIDATYNIPQTPWQDRKASIAEIQSLAARLKEFQGEGTRNAAHVRFVRVLLHEAGVIELGYRYKKRKKWRKK